MTCLDMFFQVFASKKICQIKSIHSLTFSRQQVRQILSFEFSCQPHSVVEKVTLKIKQVNKRSIIVDCLKKTVATRC